MSDLVGNPEDRFSRVEAQCVCFCRGAPNLCLGLVTCKLGLAYLRQVMVCMVIGFYTEKKL